MKKLLVAVIASLVCCCSVFAGDAAAFVDLGFSSDNGTYIFGQYGKTDKTFQAFAEIYTVDVADNDFVSGGVFRMTDKTGKTGADLFNELQKKHSAFVAKYNVRPIDSDSLLYVRGDASGASTDAIVFKDFENSSETRPIFYNIRLMPLYEGKGSNTKSSFYIILEKTTSDGEIVSRQVVGNPEIKRNGVTGYTIDRIFTSPDGKGIVFLVEKTVSDKTGISIRYMVETATLVSPVEKQQDRQPNETQVAKPPVILNEK